MQNKNEKTFNAFDIVTEAFTSLKRKQTKAILGSVFMLAIVSIVFGIMAGITGSISTSLLVVSFVYGILFIPYINFMCNVAEGRGALEDLFKKDQYSLSNILIGFLFTAATLFGSVLFLIPAFIFVTFFIFALPIASNTTSKCFDAFLKAKELAKGFKGRILCTLLIYFAMLVILIGAGIGLSFLIFKLIFGFFTWWIIGLIIGVIAYLIFIMPMNILAIVYLYDNTIAEKKENQQKLIEFKTNKQEKVEEEKSETVLTETNFTDEPEGFDF